MFELKSPHNYSDKTALSLKYWVLIKLSEIVTYMYLSRISDIGFCLERLFHVIKSNCRIKRHTFMMNKLKHFQIRSIELQEFIILKE